MLSPHHPTKLPFALLHCRRTKNNPILLGEPGVGKTAIAEGLALAIVQRACADGTALPEFLKDKRVMQLDVGLLIAGNVWVQYSTARCGTFSTVGRALTQHVRHHLRGSSGPSVTGVEAIGPAIAYEQCRERLPLWRCMAFMSCR
jgi:hypothetical protein